MTIGTTLNTITVDGNGATTTFTYPFLIPLPSDAVVTFTDANSNGTVLLTSQYSITGTGNENGGTVTYPLSGGTPIAAGTFLTIERLLPEIQSTSLSNQGPTFSAIEGALDYLTMLIQQVTNVADRAIVINPADTVLPTPLPIASVRAGQFLTFDSQGNPTVANTVGGGAVVSAAMQPVVAASTLSNAVTALFTGAAAALTTTLLTFVGIGTSFVRSVLSKLRDVVTVADFGAKGDNVQDDTAFIQAAVNECIATGSLLNLQGTSGTAFKITAPITINGGNLRIAGSNRFINLLIAHGNFSAILAFGSAASGVELSNIGLLQSGTTTQCVNFAQGSQVCKFTDCAFTGDLSGGMIYSQAAGYIEYWGCVWNCNGSGTIGIILDGYNQNTVFMGGHAGGPGTWLIIENTGGNIANNVQGTKATAFTSICTGATAITVGNFAFATQFIGCIIDQAGTNCIAIEGGASLTQLIGGYYGLAASGIPILLADSCGPGTTINGVQTFGGTNAISIQASGASRVGGVSITNNVFNAATVDTISLDSVNGCIITGNIDLSTPTNGSWATSATFGAGAYTFGNNDWWTSGPASFHTGSSYHASPDRGITLSNKGATSSVAGSSIVVSHGLTSVQPNVINVTQLGGGGMAYNVSAISGSTFTISYATPGAAAFMWTAEYYT